MPLESKALDGSESKIKRKPWRELQQNELVERVRSLAKDSLVETGMRAYDPTIFKVLTQVYRKTKGTKLRVTKALLYGNLYRGTDLLYQDVKSNLVIYEKANEVLTDHAINLFRDLVTAEEVYYKFPNSKKVRIMTQAWVPRTLGDVCEKASISIAGMYSVALCYSLYDEELANVEDRAKIEFYVKRFRDAIKTKAEGFERILKGEQYIKKAEESDTK